MLKLSEESFAAELQKVFLGEAQEMLEDTEAAFMDIEQNPDDTVKIDKIFRLLHSIKGSANMAGFLGLGAFAHSFESLLSEIREKKVRVTSDIVDILLTGNDTLKAFVVALKLDSSASVDFASVESKIKMSLTGAASTSDVAKSTPAPEVVVLKKAPEVAAPASLANSSVEGLVEANFDKSLNAKRRILICDDDEDLLDLVREILEDAGYETVCGHSGIEGLEILRNTNVDIIITDLMMPEMDGLEFVREVRKFNQLMPVIFLSGMSSREHLKTFILLGADEFIDKPFASEDILHAAARAMRIRVLRDSMVNLSRLSFRAYVSMQKIEAMELSKDLETELVKERDSLKKCMDQMKASTVQLLNSENAIALRK